MDDSALFVSDGGHFVATMLAQGGWDPRTANGGAVLALLGQYLDDVPTLTPMSVSRFTADLVRPVPLGQPLEIRSEVVREGKKIQVVELRVLSHDVEYVRATALRLREEDFTGRDGAPVGSTDDEPGDALVGPEESTSYRSFTATHPGFMRAVDLRRAPYRDGSGQGCWFRLEAPVVEGRPVGPTARLTAAIDFVNLIGVQVNSAAFTMINADVTAHVLRPPVGEWFGFTGDTRFSLGIGRGVSAAWMSDEAGVVALSSTSQLIQPR